MEITRKDAIRALGLFLFIACTPVSYTADAKPTVTWSGVGFSGDWGSRAEIYPHTSSYFCTTQPCDASNSIEIWARERLLDSGALNESNFTLKLGLIDEDALDKVGLALAIANESVVIEELSVGGKVSYLTNYSIAGSSLFFDLASKKLIYSVPLITRYTTVYDSKPDTQEQQTVFQSMLQNDSLGINFFDEMAERLAKVEFQAEPTAYLKITAASFSDDVRENFSEQFNFGAAQRFLATYFENVFVKETGYALIPNAVGHAVGNKIATRLPSGDLTIELPDPGYTMTVNVAKLLFQRKPGNGSDSFCWAARVQWQLHELVFGEETVGSTDLKNVNCAVVGHDSILSHDAEYMKLIMGMLEKYAKQFKTQDANWINKYTDNPKHTRAAIKKLNEVFAQ
ncbi:hypothetical protein [Pseudidiomarina aquimaris]|uniref:hypothetical protein n=1 Tax=Pseudidiomarina aquimaris TaxID=641841 RepID=UPI000F8694CA|nr:hypothetical protein [Pseudidiomarina aquimaris]|tara:strand:+ start:1824 stop:3017 length:1194 start_codon:yes stop_codon:yes gene_type:complete